METKPISKYSKMIDAHEITTRIEELQEKRGAEVWQVDYEDSAGGIEKITEVFDSWNEARDFVLRELEASEYDDAALINAAIEKVQQYSSEEREFDLAVGTSLWTVYADDHAICRITPEELEELEVLQEIVAGFYKWDEDGIFIHESYFKEYAMELADDCGLVPDGLQWPLTCIDWDEAAKELQMDYTVVEYMGETFLILAY